MFSQATCYDCPPSHQNPHFKDGYCRSHWEFHFKGMTNKQRMAEKKRLRTIRQQYSKANQAQLGLDPAKEGEDATNNSLRN